jgi:hypothetical protein
MCARIARSVIVAATSAAAVGAGRGPGAGAGEDVTAAGDAGAVTGVPGFGVQAAAPITEKMKNARFMIAILSGIGSSGDVIGAVRAVWVAVLITIAGAGRAAAQPAPEPPKLFTRAAFSFDWAGLAAADPRFTWDSSVSVDVDVLDTRRWRLAFATDYEAVIGGERRPFDLNQGNYEFSGTASRRFGDVELGLLTRHVSRHLVDRENPPSISWNLVGAKAWHQRRIGQSIASGSIEYGWAMQQAYVDYQWITAADVTWRYLYSSQFEWVGRAEGRVIGIIDTPGARDRVCGGRIEGALRVNGRAAAVEVFLAYERRIDGFPTDRFRVRFTAIGFRLLTK